MVWGSCLIAAAALETPTKNSYNAQGINLTFLHSFFRRRIQGTQAAPQDALHRRAPRLWRRALARTRGPWHARTHPTARRARRRRVTRLRRLVSNGLPVTPMGEIQHARWMRWCDWRAGHSVWLGMLVPILQLVALGDAASLD